jgi:hypothetical protein
VLSQASEGLAGGFSSHYEPVALSESMPC